MKLENLISIIQDHKKGGKKKSFLWEQLKEKGVNKNDYDNLCGFVYKTRLNNEEIFNKFKKFGSFTKYVKEENFSYNIPQKQQKYQADNFIEKTKTFFGFIFLLFFLVIIIYVILFEKTEVDEYRELTPEEKVKQRTLQRAYERGDLEQEEPDMYPAWPY